MAWPSYLGLLTSASLGALIFSSPIFSQNRKPFRNVRSTEPAPIKADPLLSLQAKPHERGSTKRVSDGNMPGSAKLVAFLGDYEYNLT